MGNYRRDPAHSRASNRKPEVKRNASGVLKSRTRIYPDEKRAAILCERTREALISDEDPADLSHRIGISAGTIGDLRRGRIPTLGILLLLCDYTGRTPNWFLGYEDEHPSKEV